MFFKARPVLTAVAMALVQVTAMSQSAHPILSAAEVAANRALQPQRAIQAHAFLKAQYLGLGPLDSFQQESIITNSQGQAVVRYTQLHDGIPVFGSALSVRVDPDGSSHLLARDVAPGIALASGVTLTPSEAILAAHRNIAPSGAYSTQPTAERVIFPTGLAQGMQIGADTNGRLLLDRAASLVGPRPTSGYVLAYQVKATFNNLEEGYRELNLIVDATSGQIFRKWDDAAGVLKQPPMKTKPMHYGTLAQLAASQPIVAEKPAPVAAPKAPLAPLASGAAAVDVSRAVKGWGYDQYLGLVPLDTSISPLGTGYDLIDLTRGTKPHPLFQTLGTQTWYNDLMPRWNGHVFPSDYNDPYRGKFYGSYTMDNTAWSANNLLGAGSTTNVWGDGSVYYPPYQFHEGYILHIPTAISEYRYGDAFGQTAAVGAHYATQVTYDMFKNVFGRLGIDGQDTAIISSVHDGMVNAFWSGSDQMMHYGDGDWNPTYGGEFTSFASLVIGGHEMSHGVNNHAANILYMGESMGVNEANSDILGMAVEAYSKRGPNDPANKLPEGKASWLISPEISTAGTPLRWMQNPSKDGMSQNAWFAGINNLDGHYTSGVPNRFFYFLAMGVSTDVSSDSYSPYLPQGMTGIGFDAAARIWYKALTEYMTRTTGLRGMRTPLLNAVADLYGADSTQGQAVANALAAVNIGAAYGTQGRPLVTIPNNLVDANSPLGNVGLPTQSYGFNVQAIYYSVPIVPMGEKTKLSVNVTNTADPSVTWSTGWPTIYLRFPNDYIDYSSTPQGPSAAIGSFDAEGYFHPPLQGPKFCITKATSKADPLEFAYLPVLAAMLDTDGDAETDAVDMGAFALLYNLPNQVTNAMNPGGYPLATIHANYSFDEYIGYGFDDWSLQAWNEAFMNAFGH